MFVYLLLDSKILIAVTYRVFILYRDKRDKSLVIETFVSNLKHSLVGMLRLIKTTNRSYVILKVSSTQGYIIYTLGIRYVSELTALRVEASVSILLLFYVFLFPKRYEQNIN